METLSDKIVLAQYKRFEDEMMPVRYVKEFIKNIKDGIREFAIHKTGVHSGFLCREIDKLAGDKLIDANVLEGEE